MQPTNPFQASLQIFTKPNGVFEAANNNNNWSWIPFILVMSFVLLPIYLYYNFVDFEWYRDFIVNSTAGNLSPAEQNNIRAQIKPDFLVTGMLIVAFLFQVIINLILAAYLNLVAKTDDECINGFTDWYGFTWWVSLPSVIGFIAALISLTLAENNQISIGQLNPLALSYWLSLDEGSKWYGLANLIKPELFFSIYLIAVGLSRWTKFNSSKIYTIAIAPFAIIIVLWFFLLLMK
ncbi:MULTISPECIES: YIP1 family protein [Alteromonadaceae]|uniref:YIP1 family protein n=1 Tax=Alteromonadaceae TaxID=72275 RepID=UPI001C083427|nr:MULTISPECIES: YIP1 family protein [Aliiglaciecola]MBU2880015.1 YIP1 family protein [Aliiglaciecola lipolytica]MDO6710987.1 YIP1 family protein [Aliiglaciecola sp. 2_MG-2023]MDO6752468.1 YIP1 family protein [Aliiglaciecola sp. 1_MG-2023]